MERQEGSPTAGGRRGVNPFALGLLGLGLMLAGYAAMTYRFDQEDARRARMQETAADRLESSDKQAADALRANAAPSPTLVWLGRLLFWGGVVLVVYAGVIWYRQAQLPEPPRRPIADEPDVAETADVAESEED
jgi:hypothetical protein